jgi:SP family myo-inositol transporter-like MFS transporter 13
MYFSATILQSIGFSQPTLASLGVSGTNFAFTVAALLLIDRVGRRRMLVYSIPAMILSLLLAAYGFSRIAPSSTDDGTDRTAAAGVVLASMMLYVAAYAIGLGNVPWMQSELFPLSVRALGSGVATATNWAANFVVGLTFLPLMDALGPPWTFVLYACVCTAGYGLVVAIYPETAGLSL